MNCFLCKTPDAQIRGVPNKDESIWTCKACGNFYVSEIDISEYEELDLRDRAVYFAYTREHTEHGSGFPFLRDRSAMNDIVEKYQSASPMQKIDAALMYIKKHSDVFGKVVEWDHEYYYPLTYSPDREEMENLLEAAEREGLIESNDEGLKLTISGWGRAVAALKSLRLPSGHDDFLILS